MTRPPARVTQADVARAPEPDDPITLQEACELAFRGNITIASLRVERGWGSGFIERRVATPWTIPSRPLEPGSSVPRT